MWKKGESPENERYRNPEAVHPGDEPTATSHSSGQAIIGRSITIRGDVTGDENLVIEGRVEGSVDLDQHAVTIGPQGLVKANIMGRVVTVEGRVEGNVTGGEQVVLRKSSWVRGDLKAPRVVLEDGAHFRGGVQMGEDTVPIGRAATVEPIRKSAAAFVSAPADKASVALKTAEAKA